VVRFAAGGSVSELPSSVGDAPVAHQPGRVIAFKPRNKGGDGFDRPVIEIVPGELPRMVGQCIAALAANDPNLFQRNGELVTITRQPERAEDITCDGRDGDRACRTCGAPVGEACAVDYRHGASIITRTGTPVVKPLGNVITLRAALAAQWMRWDKSAGEKIGKDKASGAMVDANPCRETMRQVSEMGDYQGIDPLRGVLETPAFARGGRVISTPGYDRGTAFFLLPAFKMDPIPEHPTQKDGAEALSYMWREMYCDFPFAGVEPAEPGDIDRHGQYEHARKCAAAFVGIASILTVLARPAIDGAVPGFIFEAATPGSGKSLHMHITSMVTTGRAAGVMTFPMSKGDPNEEELEKVLAGYALAGARMVAFDNITGNLCGAALDKVLTAFDTIMLRVLGSPDMRELAWSAVAMFSGNNMTTSPDVAGRTMVSRLVSPLENPRGRAASDFRHPELLAWIKAHLPALLRAAFVVLRAFWCSKDKDASDCGIRGSFEAWSRIIPRAIKYCGGPNVIEAWSEDSSGASGGDEMSTAHGAILAAWPFDVPCKASEIIGRVFKDEYEIATGKAAPDGYEDLREAIRTVCKCPTAMVKASVLGAALAKLRDKIRGGLMLVRDMRSGVAWWRVTGRKTPAVAPQAPPVAVAPPASPEPATTPPVVAPGRCPACSLERGRGAGKCQACGVCAGCFEVPPGEYGACCCEAG
jgi:hypothetical protein